VYTKLIMEALLVIHPFCLGNELILIDIRKPPFGKVPVLNDMAGSSPVEPF
jgi:hypothetical protein